ncbi:MAG: SDR family NAD(P)-dependent oxidoreductase [Planctomycetota bacterium]|jgi:NAD(P)-dependent dehydrogenase (short-subunit alcohol dehydrogenase family)
MADLLDKVIFLTGATDGIGRLTAEGLAQRGATLLLHGRDQARLEATRADIGAATGNNHLYTYHADYAELVQVRTLAGTVRTAHPRIDVLINNAGIGSGGMHNTQRELSLDGHELRFQVNYLAPFLVTQLLMPALLAAAPARIVMVASAGQLRIDFADVMLARSFDGRNAYRQSKLALILFTFSLAERLEGTGVTVNALHPGSLLNTKMVRDTFDRHRGEPEEGAEAEIYLATDPSVEGVGGRYFDQMTQARAEAQAYDQTARRQLWGLSVELTGLEPSEVFCTTT